MSFFEVKNLSAGYGGRQVISGVSFSAEKGRLLGVLGANGSGKTTLLKALCGILPHGGECALNGRRLEGIPPRQLARLCAYIPQRSGISIDISALDVVLMGFNPRLGLLEYPDAQMKRQAASALEMVGLGGMAEKNYMQLSEGQKQLCILARTLAADAQLLLLDEPESALDFRCRYRMLDLIGSWVREGERCAVVALHDPMLALNYCDELLLISGGSAAGSLRPGADSLSEMEQKLAALYGGVSLHIRRGRDGREQLVMLKERDEA